LQRCAPQISCHYHQQTPTHPEECSTDRSTGAKAIRHRRHYSASFTGCQLNSGSATSWLCRCSKFKVRITSINAVVAKSTRQNSSQPVDSSLVASNCIHQAVRQHSLRQAVLSAAWLQRPGTLCHALLLTVILLLPLRPD